MSVTQGDKGPEVEDLQALINRVGIQVEPSGTFDAATVAAVRKLKKITFLPNVDASVGDAEWTAFLAYDDQVNPPRTDPRPDPIVMPEMQITGKAPMSLLALLAGGYVAWRIVKG